MSLLPSDLGLVPVGTSISVKSPEDSRGLAAIGGNYTYGSQALQAYGLPLPRDYEKFLAVFSNSVWVYACVWIASTNASSVPFYLVDDESDSEAERMQNVPILDMPNEFMSFEDLQEASYVALELIGNAYWEIVGDEAYWLRPDRVHIVPHSRKLVREYVYKIGQSEERFLPEDIVHFKYFNPTHDFYGLAPLAPARLSVDSDFDGRKLYRRFFENAAIPAAVLETDMPNITPELRDTLREEVRNLYVGLDRAFQPMILPSGLKWHDIQVKPQDLAIVPLNEMSRAEILGAFRVPPILVGLETMNYAVAREQRFSFWSNKVQPMHRQFKRCFNQQYLKRNFPGVKAFGKYDYSGVAALQDPWKEMGEFVASIKDKGILSANEARAVVNTFVSAIDLTAFPGGDTIWEDLNKAPVATTNGSEIIMPRVPEPAGDSGGDDEKAGTTGRYLNPDYLSTILKRIDKELNRTRLSSLVKTRVAMMQSYKEARRIKVAQELIEGRQPSDGTPIDPGFFPEYEEHRREKSAKYQEKRARNPVLYTPAGRVALYQQRRFSKKHGY